MNPTTCKSCGLPIFHGPAGYAGPQCMCRWTNAAPRQPEGEGLEVVAWVVTGISSERARSTLGRTRRAFLVSQHDADQQHANWLPHYQSVTTDELCRLSDAQRAIAELREELHNTEVRLTGMTYDRNCRLEELATLRQQLAEAESAGAAAAASACDGVIGDDYGHAFCRYKAQRDKLAGLLGEVISKRKRLTLDEVKRIDAALAEVNK